MSQEDVDKREEELADLRRQLKKARSALRRAWVERRLAKLETDLAALLAERPALNALARWRQYAVGALAAVEDKSPANIAMVAAQIASQMVALEDQQLGSVHGEK